MRDAFRDKGHRAVSCDILSSDSPYHRQTDVLKILDEGWDMLIAFPPCTYLCSSGLHWNKRDPARADQTTHAIEFFNALAGAPIEKIAVENPIGCMSTHFRKPDQIIQPYQFGEDASKSTCLWLKNLPKLIPTKYIEPRMVDGKMRWANQTDSGQNKLGPSPDRGMLRSITYRGISLAMADQWG